MPPVRDEKTQGPRNLHAEHKAAGRAAYPWWQGSALYHPCLIVPDQGSQPGEILALSGDSSGCNNLVKGRCL